MRILSLIIAIVLMPLIGWSASYGFLRVIVLERNPEHMTHVALKINGQRAAEFSHSRSEPLFVEIKKEMLAIGNSTPLVSDYTGLQQGCEFNYSLSFSYDKTSWIDLGTFKAPNSFVQKSLPIGLCEGSICSNDKTIQAAIQKVADQKWQKQGELIRDWLQKGLDQERAQAQKIQDRLEAERKSAKEFEDISSTIAQTEKLTHAQVDQKPELTVPEPPQSLDTVIAEAYDSGTIEQLIEKNGQEEKFLNSCAQMDQAGQYLCDKYGGMGWIGAAAEVISIGLSANPEAASQRLTDRMLDPSIQSNLQSAIERKAEMRLRIQKVVEGKRTEEQWNKIAEATRTGIAFTPLNDVLDFCEAATGRALCVPSGRVLSDEDRYLATLGLFIGSGKALKEIADLLRFTEEEIAIMKRLSQNPEAMKLSRGLITEHKTWQDAVKIMDPVVENERLKKLRGYTEKAWDENEVFLSGVVSEDKKMVRFFSGEGGFGSWAVDIDMVKGKTPEEIRKMLALKSPPTKWIEFTAQKSETIYSGIPAQNAFGGGADQRIRQYFVDSPAPETFGASGMIGDKFRGIQ